MASEFFGKQRECRFYTAGCGNKMAVSVTGPRAVNEAAQSYRVLEIWVVPKPLDPHTPCYFGHNYENKRIRNK